jgi:ABC-type transporter Mla maintaining outer membrane lipid asymmetry ATPase subunit MlaF
MADPVIQMTDVTVVHSRAPGVPLVTGVNWRVEEGECWVVTGLQGSGKTALIETAAGLHPYPTGEVQIFGQRVHGTEGEGAEEVRRRVGVVFDGHGRLFGSQTVLENVALPLCYHRNRSWEEVGEEVMGLLQLLGLETLAGQLAGRLARAWAHRVALARALVQRPGLLLVDNPLTGMDPSHARWWRAFLGRLLVGLPELGGVPMTLVLATDEPRALLGLGRKFAVTHAGRWRCMGDRQEFERCNDPELRGLLYDEE